MKRLALFLLGLSVLIVTCALLQLTWLYFN